MKLPPSQERGFVDNDLSPALTKAGLSTRILGYDWDWKSSSWSTSDVESILSGAPSNVAGTAWHCYGGDPSTQSTIEASYNYPRWLSFITECSGVGVDSGYGITGSTTEDNFALHLDTSTNTVSYTVDNYVLTEASSAFESGARMIATSSSNGLQAVAGLNPDNTTGLYVSNPSQTSATFTVNDGGEGFTYTIPGYSVASFRWSNKSQANPVERLRNVTLRCSTRPRTSRARKMRKSNASFPRSGLLLRFQPCPLPSAVRTVVGTDENREV
jgi:glucosylceramidase